MAVSQGENRGVTVPISRSQLIDAGVDPNRPISVNRTVFDSDRPTIRLRLYNEEPEEEDDA